jgi:hypothetical protein
MITSYYDGRDLMGDCQPVELLSRYSENLVSRADGVEEITGMDADIRLELDDLVDRLNETGDNIFLT